MKKLIYISHPSSGKLENTLDVELIIETLYRHDFLYKSCVFVSPIHNFGFMYHTTEYLKGLTYCIDLLLHCDEMWVFGDWSTSRGCTAEIEFCQSNNIPIRYMGDSKNLETKIIEEFPDDTFTTPHTERKIDQTVTYYTCIDQDELDLSKVANKTYKDILKGKKLYDSITVASLSIKDKNKRYAMIEVELNTSKMIDLDSDEFAVLFSNYAITEGRGLSEKKAFNKYIKEQSNNNRIHVIKRLVQGNKTIYKRGKIKLGSYSVAIITNMASLEDIRIYNNYNIDNDRVIIGGNIISQ